MKLNMKNNLNMGHLFLLCDIAYVLTLTYSFPIPKGWTVLYSEVLEKDWKEKHEDWVKRSRCESQIFLWIFTVFLSEIFKIVIFRWTINMRELS